MRTEARFPGVESDAGHYESFYIKATEPGGGRAIWIRHTVHKRPGAELTGSLWVSLFDAGEPRPRAMKVTVEADSVSVPRAGYIQIADAVLGRDIATGEARTEELSARWNLTFTDGPEPFRHLPYDFLYRARLPKTKLLSPYPNSRFSGAFTFAGERIDLDDWPGMIGHNWGAEHAERWIWIEANEFREADGFFDAGLGRIRVGPMTTPWIGNAVLELDGERHRLGGLDRLYSTTVDERPTECGFELSGKGIKVRGRIAAEPRHFVGWVYADPVGPEHNTVNCSISDLSLFVERKGHSARRLECAGAAAYELGMRETDHGIPIQPYPDG
jgi:hypothetical protein